RPSSTAFRYHAFLLTRQAPRPTLFPYTTLFRSTASSASTGSGPPAEKPAASVVADFCQTGRESFIFRVGREGSGHLLRQPRDDLDRKSTRLNSSHVKISYAVFCLKKESNILHVS